MHGTRIGFARLAGLGMLPTRSDVRMPSTSAFGKVLPKSRGDRILELRALGAARSTTTGQHLLADIIGASSWDDALEKFQVETRGGVVPPSPQVLNAVISSALRSCGASNAQPTSASATTRPTSLDRVFSILRYQAINANGVEVDDLQNGNNWIQDDTMDPDQVDMAPADRINPRLDDAVAQRIILYTLDTVQRTQLVLPPSGWSDLALLASRNSSLVNWRDAVLVYSAARRQCGHETSHVALAAAMHTCLKHSRWDAAVALYLQDTVRSAERIPSVAVACCALYASRRIPNEDSVWALSLRALRDISDAVEDNAFNLNPVLASTAADLACLALSHAARHGEVCKLVDGMDALEVPSSRLWIPNCDALLLAASSALADRAVTSRDKRTTTANQFFRLWGKWYRAEFASASPHALFQFWNVLADAVRDMDAAGVHMVVRLAIKAASEARSMSFGQLRGVPILLATAVSSNVLSATDRDSIWQAALQTLLAADAVADRMDDAFIFRIAASTAFHPRGFAAVEEFVKTSLISHEALAEKLPLATLRFVARESWRDGLSLLMTLSARASVKVEPQHVNAVIGACASQGAWAAAFAVSRRHFHGGLRDMPPWVLGTLSHAIVSANVTSKWELAIRCFGLASPFSPHRRTRLASFLVDAGLDDQRAGTIVTNQPALRAFLSSDAQRSLNRAGAAAQTLDAVHW